MRLISREYKDFAFGLLVIVLLFSLCENVILLREVRKQQSAARSDASQIAALQPGDAVPAIRAFSLDGKPQDIDLASDRILFVYSQHCPFSRANFANWKEVEEQVGPQRVLYLSVDPVSESGPFAREKGIEDRTLVISDEGDMKKLKLDRIPQTIRINNGKVVRVFVGLLSTERIKLVSRSG